MTEGSVGVNKVKVRVEEKGISDASDPQTHGLGGVVFI
jgi:hypothetical protein